MEEITIEFREASRLRLQSKFTFLVWSIFSLFVIGNVCAQGGGPAVGLKLLPSWNEPYGGKVHSIDDLKKVLKPINKGRLDSSAHPNLQLLKGVHYLMPIEDATEDLKLGRVVAGQIVGTPGFPWKTLHYKAFDGNFGGGFNKLYLILDGANQVVSAQFVNESPGGINRGPGNKLALLSLGKVIHQTSNVQVFNFITQRKKGSTGATVRIEVKPVLGVASSGKNKGKGSNGNKPALFVVDSTLRTTAGTKEIVRWVVPQPIVDLIYHCCTMEGVGKGLSSGGLSTGGL